MGIVPDPAPPRKNGGGKPVLATYPYHDENNVLLFEIVRFDTTDRDERFRPRQPDGKGGWVWNIKGVRWVLYRLPELIAAVKAEQLVLVPEGEKDANTAVKLGYVAMTMPGGVGKWRNEYDEFFRDADVVIVSDNDPQLKDPKTGKPQFHPDGRPVLPGQDHAANLAKRLSKVAKRVRTIMFEVKDLSDWVATGGAREQLDALIEQAPERQPRPKDEQNKHHEHHEHHEPACRRGHHRRVPRGREHGDVHRYSRRTSPHRSRATTRCSLSDCGRDRRGEAVGRSEAKNNDRQRSDHCTLHAPG
jgi:hypothetical protein